MDENPYEVGWTVRGRNPAEEEYRHMLHLVAYDVRNPKRLRRVAKVCEGYGIRVEYSVFECDLAQELFERLWADLSAEIDWEQDAVLAYRICGSCVKGISSMGQVTRPTKPLLYML
jgi:CRISPR-associated protein Cas2